MGENRRIVRENVTEDLNLQKLRQVTKDAVALVTKEDWEWFCRHTETVESQYWERDGILPDVIDRIVINLNPGSDSYSDGKNSDTDFQSDCDNSDAASEDNNATPDEDTDMELAQPLFGLPAFLASLKITVPNSR
jgi:hypothetical protein